ncbi:MAG: 16S rRNA (guanine(527)-N(7))-methyltransferase RsmG [Fibrobacter sp.]|nr:16S rRNA (guanine(527)-N(7))-methyltransferase RsmG [Fibrobacter sp.]
MNKEIFISFLKESFPDNYKVLLTGFEAYYRWLLEENKKINLISRKADPQSIWTTHFLDSLLAIKHVDFRGKKVLDFGTGGGFPGIPIAICFPSAHITLLDSIKKKVQSLRSAVSHLGLQNCSFIDKRLEEIHSGYIGKFDIILCRSVKIEPKYKKPLLNLLSEKGLLVLYKSQILDDAGIFENVQIYDLSTPSIGERKIVVVRKNSA